MRTGFDDVHKDIIDIRSEQKETNRHLDSIGRKQIGTLESLDGAVLRSEFGELKGRVVVLEKRMA